MADRYRVEIYDEVKSNDLTIYSETKVDKEHLDEIVYSNLTHFDGNVKAFVFDNLKKKKIAAAFVPLEITQALRKSIPQKLDFGL